MTIIAGFNLSDRIYIIGDTRITTSTHIQEGKICEIKKDNIQKVIDINPNLIIAAAGNMRLARFLIKRFVKSDLANLPINNIRLRIKDWMALNVDEYHQRYEYAHVCLIFAGRDSSKKKVIDGKKLLSLTKEFSGLNKNPQMQLKDVIYKGLKAKPNIPNPFPELPIDNTILFSVVSDFKNLKLDIEDTEWGDYLVYGSKGFSKKDVPKTMLGQLEFEMGCVNPWNNLCVLTAFIISSKEEFNLDNVGGTVIPMMIHGKEGLLLLTGNVNRVKLGAPDFTPEQVSNLEIINNKLYYKSPEGIITPLIKFTEYPGSSGNCVI